MSMVPVQAKWSNEREAKVISWPPGPRNVSPVWGVTVPMRVTGVHADAAACATADRAAAGAVNTNS